MGLELLNQIGSISEMYYAFSVRYGDHFESFVHFFIYFIC